MKKSQKAGTYNYNFRIALLVQYVDILAPIRSASLKYVFASASIPDEPNIKYFSLNLLMWFKAGHFECGYTL